MVFKYHKIRTSIPAYPFFIPYATFSSVQYDFLKPRKEDVVIDAGANIGHSMAKIARKASSAISINPSGDNLSYLNRITEGMQDSTIIQKAVGNKRGITGFTG